MTSGSSDTDGGESKSARKVNRRRFLAASAVSVAGLAGCVGGGGGDGDGDGAASPTEAPSTEPPSTEPPGTEPPDTGGGGTTPGEPQESNPFAGETLTAAVWSGGENWMNGFTQEIVPRFEEKTGATVELATVWASILPKIKAAPEDDPPWDVTVGDAYVGYYGEQAELFNRVNYDNVPNFDDVYQFLKDFRGHEYGVPVSGMPMAILFRTEQTFAPETWSDFGTEQGVNANLSMEGSWHAYASHTAAIAMDDVPKAGEMYDEQYHKDVFQTLHDWNIDSWYSGGAEFWEQLRNGVVDASQYYMNTHRDAEDDPEIGFRYPTEGSVWYWDHYRIVRGTDKQALSEAWINHLLDPEIQELSANLQYNAAANTQTEYQRPILKENYPQSEQQWESKAVFFELPYLPNHWGTFSDYFKQVKTGNWQG